MNRLNKISAVLLVILSCILLVACGGSTGESSQQLEAVYTFSLAGPPATIGWIELEVELPIGFVLEAETDGSTKAGIVTAADTLPLDTGLAAKYIPEEAPAPGRLIVGLVSGVDFDVNADSVNLFTVTRVFSSGSSLPDPADFKLVVLDFLGIVDLADYTLAIDVQLNPVESL